MKIRQHQAKPGDVLLDGDGTEWKRGDDRTSWRTFDGLVTYEGPWLDAYGPQGLCDLIERDGKPVPAARV